MEPPPPPRVVCFDLGGVLVRICRSWEEACRRLGLPTPRPETFMSPERVARRRELVDAFQRGAITETAWSVETAAATGGQYSPEQVARVLEVWTLEEYPGAHDLVRALGDVPALTTACLSNTNATHWRRLVPSVPLTADAAAQSYQAPALLDRHFASHQLGLLKPEPAIFERVQQALGVEPAQILFFDDLPEHVAEARRQGWQAESIDPRGDTVAQMRAALRQRGLLGG